jgi:hypothetical protein
MKLGVQHQDFHLQLTELLVVNPSDSLEATIGHPLGKCFRKTLLSPSSQYSQYSNSKTDQLRTNIILQNTYFMAQLCFLEAR